MLNLQETCKQSFSAGLSAVNASHLVDVNVEVDGDFLTVQNKSYALRGRVLVLGIGKACLGMVRSLMHKLQERLHTAVCCTTPPDTEAQETYFRSNVTYDKRLSLFYGSRNNLPTEDVIKASYLMSKVAFEAQSDDLLLVCVTGGGSALLTLPKYFQSGRLPLTPILQTIKSLSGAGANITELNAVRRCFDELKAGGLACMAYPAQVVSLVISDVIGDQLDFIASGPTIIPSHEHQLTLIPHCLSIVNRYALLNKIPIVIREFLESEKNKVIPVDTRKHRVDNWILGSNRTALEAMARVLASSYRESVIHNPGPTEGHCSQNLAREGSPSYDLMPILLTSKLQGDAEEQGERLADLSWATANHLKFIFEADHSAAESPYLERILHLISMIVDSTEALGIVNQINQACGHVATAETVLPSGICYLLGGEANVAHQENVTNSRRSGADGGRCSHLGLAFARRFFLCIGKQEALSTSYEIGLLAGASDGLDGPHARGGGVWVDAWPKPTVGDQATCDAAKEAIMLKDSYGFFSRHQPTCILPPILTGTNVMDCILAAVVLHRSTTGRN